MIWIAHTAIGPDSSDSDAGVLEEVEAVKKALEELGHPYTIITPEPSLLDFLSQISQNPKDDLVFNLVEGYRGTPWGESWIASFYEAFQIAYTGSPPTGLGLCLDKRRARAVLQQAGLPVAPGLALTNGLPKIEFGFPVILKPACRDASEGLTPNCVVNDTRALKKKIKEMRAAGFSPLLIEKYIPGREFSITLAEWPEWKPISIFEIDFSGLPPEAPHILCFDAKWHTETEVYIGTTTNPMKEDVAIRDAISALALRAVEELGLHDYVRIDLRYSTEGQMYILDINPNPDISLDGGFFRAMAAANVQFVDFVQQILENAKARRHGFAPHTKN